MKYKSDFRIIKSFPNRFQFMKYIRSVFYIDSVYGDRFEGIFFIQMIPSHYSSIIVADHGSIKKSFDGTQWLILNSGNCYFWNSGDVLYQDFYITHFNENKILINKNQHSLQISTDDLVEEMFVNQLWFVSDLKARVELHWRLTLIFVVFIMVMIVVPLSLRRLNSTCWLNIFFSVILYLLFVFVQVFLRFYVLKGYIHLSWIWVINFLYVLIFIMLNLWDSVIFRNLRWRFRLYTNNWD